MNSKLEKKLTLLSKHFGVHQEKFVSGIKTISKSYNSTEDKKQIVDFIQKLSDDDLTRIDNFIADTKIKLQLAEVSEIVSMAYISKRYFNKSRQWLNVRINGGLVNGKPATFTADDKIIMNYALKDIGRKISSTVIL